MGLTEDPVAFSSPYADSLFSFRGTHNSGNTFQIAVGGWGRGLGNCKMPRQKNELLLMREGICVQLGKGLEEDKPSRQNSLSSQK